MQIMTLKASYRDTHQAAGRHTGTEEMLNFFVSSFCHHCMPGACSATMSLGMIAHVNASVAVPFSNSVSMCIKFAISLVPLLQMHDAVLLLP